MTLILRVPSRNERAAKTRERYWIDYTAKTRGPGEAFLIVRRVVRAKHGWLPKHYLVEVWRETY